MEEEEEKKKKIPHSWFIAWTAIAQHDSPGPRALVPLYGKSAGNGMCAVEASKVGRGVGGGWLCLWNPCHWWVLGLCKACEPKDPRSQCPLLQRHGCTVQSLRRWCWMEGSGEGRLHPNLAIPAPKQGIYYEGSCGNYFIQVVYVLGRRCNI